MYINWNTIITIASVLTALGVIFGVIFGCYRWYLKIENKSSQHDALEARHDEDVRRLKEENRLICFALDACLDGLEQLGANHSVPRARQMLQEFLNQQAHE